MIRICKTHGLVYICVHQIVLYLQDDYGLAGFKKATDLKRSHPHLKVSYSTAVIPKIVSRIRSVPVYFVTIFCFVFSVNFSFPPFVIFFVCFSSFKFFVIFCVPFCWKSSFLWCTVVVQLVGNLCLMQKIIFVCQPLG